MSERITLRLKSDPSVVLPEATDAVEKPRAWVVRYGNANWNWFDKNEWEPVPPPYKLPSGIGAVVTDADGDKFVRFDKNAWMRHESHTNWTDYGILELSDLVTLSEGVDL